MKLFEGKYDEVTGSLVDIVWVIIKKSKEIYDNTGNELYATKIHKTEHLKFQIIVSRQIIGGYKLDANTRLNKIVISLIIDPETEPEIYSELNNDLQGTIRHEIEHILQEKGVPEKAEFPSKYMIDKINRNDYDYLIADYETEAMVKGFYRQAKTQKEKLDVVMSEFLRYYIKDKRITKGQAKEIKDKWIAYAKKHLPKALYKKINEVQHFTRGLDPKRAMGTGDKDAQKRSELLPLLNPTLRQFLDKHDITTVFLNNMINDPRVIDDYNIKRATDNNFVFLLKINFIRSAFGWGNSPEGFDYWETIDNLFYKFYKIATELQESQNFTRGLEPKEAMGTGILKYSIRRALLKNPAIDSEGVWYWLNQLNPTIGKILGIDTVQDVKSVFSFDMEWYCEDENIDYDELMKDFKPNKAIAEIGGVGLKYRLGTLKQSGGRVLYYFGDTQDGFISTTKWLGLNEAQNFQRGLDPKVAMSTGDVVERASQDIQKAITKLAEKYSSYALDQIEISKKEAFIKYEFYKTYDLETWKFFIGYRKINDSFLQPWYAGWTKVNETWLNKRACIGQPTMNVMEHFDNLDGCVEKLENKLQQSINETQHFTRGLDPRDAMATGDVIGRHFKKECARIKKAITMLAKESEHEDDIYEEHPDDDQLSYTVGFNMTKTLTYSINYTLWTTGNPAHISHEQYCAQFATPNNPNGEDNTGDDYCYDVLMDAITALRNWIDNKTGEEYDYEPEYPPKIYVKESQNFQRGIDPKDAMATGDVEYRFKEKIKKQIEVAMFQLAKKFGGYGVKDVTGKDEIRYNFYKQYGTSEWIFYIGNELDNEEWLCGWYRNWSGDTQPHFSSEDEEEYYYSSLERCIERISNELAEDLVESQNFTRGIDPRDAMGTGIKSLLKPFEERRKPYVTSIVYDLLKEEPYYFLGYFKDNPISPNILNAVKNLRAVKCLYDDPGASNRTKYCLYKTNLGKIIITKEYSYGDREAAINFKIWEGPKPK